MGGATPRRKLLAGFVKCGECGGSFHRLSRDVWGRSHHRNRGTCGNTLTLNTKPLEEAVMRGVRQALTEDVAEHLGRVLHKSHQGKLDISWTGNPDICRVSWERIF